MKKIMYLILVLLLVISFIGCSTKTIETALEKAESIISDYNENEVFIVFESEYIADENTYKILIMPGSVNYDVPEEDRAMVKYFAATTFGAEVYSKINPTLDDFDVSILMMYVTNKKNVMAIYNGRNWQWAN